ncbi:MAG: hypothetical protein OZ913_01275 [Ignavibacteriaceae bacterium]|jgi:hypothetical protein|nr:MAG: hypothetical protein EDM69_00270 [Chlorobiota bacterium]KXK03713.1 MAG: hypothetical protein UZ04_CHB001001355 [Chlorobi bacterium OLB4]MBV6398893.1 hypothetical protein [Ignavibacteria bacterium]MCC6886268.1 hypothetical protein [Ignavibacteriales bacterium]MCE7952278.1 hypothetical protein [Chlorobi bacterium CHB7]MEB2328917.1 hypothetical protein [Ignavibacteriaceae bacterium]OQY77025.1 MAG: hypothetical protein B6D43_07900 [Ignavibacteriales bacterium UTCHB1]RIK48536.1 MAG: hypot
MNYTNTENLDNHLNSLYKYCNPANIDNPKIEYSVQIYIPYRASVYLYFEDSENRVIFNIINGEILNEGIYSKNVDLSELPGGVYHYVILINGEKYKKTLYLDK